MAEAREMHNTHKHVEGIRSAVKGALAFKPSGFTLDDLNAIIKTVERGKHSEWKARQKQNCL